MKKIIKPAEKEESVYYSDFNGTQFNSWGPEVELNIEFNYGSKHDGSSLTFHLTDEEFQVVFECIKNHISDDYKQTIKKALTRKQNNLDQSIQSRDWDCCNYNCNSINLYKKLLDS